MNKLNYFKSSCLFLLLSVISINSYSQEGYTPYKFPEKISENFYSKRKEEYQKMVSKKIPAGVKKREYEQFAQLVIYGKAEMFTSGEVYLGWNELEDYLNDILQKILPKELKGKNNIHIYPLRDADYNACALHDGSLFFNIGLLAEAENEAALAAIIGHELSHYYKNDLEESFINKVKKTRHKKKIKNLKSLTFQLVHDDQKREQIADTLGFRWSLNAGYNVKEAIHNFHRFLDDEKIATNKSRGASITNVYVNEKSDGTKEEKSLDQLLASHPETTDRIQIFNKFCNKNISNQELSNFLVKDESFFKALQQKARYESLEILMEKMDFSDCIERAFLYHLFDPTNQTYIYYILESERRAMYLDHSLSSKGFLSEEYSEYFKGENFNILKKLNLLIRNDEKLKQIKAVDFIDSLNTAFLTYKESFDYFSKLCKKNIIKEGYLTMALASKNSTKRDSLLNAYLSFSDIKYRKFAGRLLAGTLYDQNFKRDLILTEGVSFYNINRFGTSLDMVKTESENKAYFANLSHIKSAFKNLDILFVSEVMEKSFSDAIDLQNAISSSAVIFMHEQNQMMDQENLDLFMLNPYYFDLLEKYQVKSFSFLVTKSYDDKREIKNVVNVINPLFYYFLTTYVMKWMIYGTSRYSYDIAYFVYEPGAKERLTYYNSSANYKLTKMNFLNAVYYSLIDE